MFFGSARHALPVLRMNEPTWAQETSGCLPPLFESKTDVIERTTVGIKTFTIRSKYRNLLRREVHDLPEFHFLLPDLLLGPLPLSDVDYGAYNFDEMARLAHDRMAYRVNVPDATIWMHDAVIPFKLSTLSNSRLSHFPEARSVVGMNPLKKVFLAG